MSHRFIAEKTVQTMLFFLLLLTACSKKEDGSEPADPHQNAGFKVLFNQEIEFTSFNEGSSKSIVGTDFKNNGSCLLVFKNNADLLHTMAEVDTAAVVQTEEHSGAGVEIKNPVYDLEDKVYLFYSTGIDSKFLRKYDPASGNFDLVWEKSSVEVYQDMSVDESLVWIDDFSEGKLMANSKNLLKVAFTYRLSNKNIAELSMISYQPSGTFDCYTKMSDSKINAELDLFDLSTLNSQDVVSTSNRGSHTYHPCVLIKSFETEISQHFAHTRLPVTSPYKYWVENELLEIGGLDYNGENHVHVSLETDYPNPDYVYLNRKGEFITLRSSLNESTGKENVFLQVFNEDGSLKTSGHVPFGSDQKPFSICETEGGKYRLIALTNQVKISMISLDIF